MSEAYAAKDTSASPSVRPSQDDMSLAQSKLALIPETARASFFERLQWKPELIMAIQTFAHLPHLWIDPSHLKEPKDPEAVDLYQRLAAEAGANRMGRKMAQQIELEFDLPALDYHCFEPLPLRLALLSPQMMAELVYQAGLYMLIAEIDDTETRQRVLEQLSPEQLESILSSAPVILGANFEPMARIPRDWSSRVKESAVSTGWYAFGSIFSDAPKTLTKRLKIKTPIEVAKSFKAGRKRPILSPDRSFELFLRILKNNIDRKLASCIF